MKKTSVYLGDADERRLKEIAAREGLSQAEVIRAAIEAYAARTPPPREFALSGCVENPAVRASELSDEELLLGFGE